jgi:long-chain acyl-CoA synthetase
MPTLIRSGPRSLTAEQLAERAMRAANGLEALGIGAGDVVALFLRNDLAFYEATGAAARVGAYVAPLNWHATEAEALYLFANCGAKAIIIHADLLPGVAAAVPKGVAVLVVETSPEIAAAYGIGPDQCAVPPGHTNWSDWLEGHVVGEPRAPAALSAIIYTGGTTGNPKGVRRPPSTPEQTAIGYRTLGTAFGFGEAVSAILSGNEPPQMVTVMAGPMYHSAPNAYGNSIAAMGAEVILQPRFDPEEP